MKLGQIARRLGCELEGDPNLEITGVAGIKDAQPGQLTFLANRRYSPEVEKTRASAILIARDAAEAPLAALRSDNPYLDFARAIEFFHAAPRYAAGVHATAVVAPSAKIGEGAHIGPYCFVDENVEIGRNAVLHSFVVIYRGAQIGQDFFAHSHSCVREGCRIGNRVILQNGVVIGGDGFGFARLPDGSWYKMRQAGTAIIDDDVEIQTNSAVDRATVGETRIGRGSKLDNLVQVGHSSKVGEDTLLCGQVGLAGSTRIGNHCILAGQAASGGHLTIGDGSVLTGQSGAGNDIPPKASYSGSPAIPTDAWYKSVAVFNRLPELRRAVRELKTEVEHLRQRTR
jgi:UDP-3-O-[3-hydroxymyristoyl] glucosamine N-acyltransferase